MENLLKDKLFIAKLIGFIGVVAIGFNYAYNLTEVENRVSNFDYDEQMWTGASITSYHIFFNDYMRKNAQLDKRWFVDYAKKHDLDINQMSREELQWFDVMMWTFGWKAPNVGKYIMGKKIVNTHPDADPEGYFTFNKEKNRIECTPPDEMVLSARKPNAFMSGMRIMLIFLIGWIFLHYSVGITAALYVGLNHTFHHVNSGAGLNSSSGFFAMLTLLLGLLYIREIYKAKDWKIPVGLAVGLGISFALAVGSKLNMALIGFVALFVFGIMLLVEGKKFMSGSGSKTKAKKKKKKETSSAGQPGFMLKMLLISGVIFAGLTYQVFIYTNPVYKTEPFKKVQIVRESVDDFFTIRARAANVEYLKNSWMESFKLVAKRNFVNVQDKYVENIQRHKYFGTIGYYLPFKMNPLDGVFIFLGLGLALFYSIKYLKEKQKVNALLFIALYTVIILYGNIDFMWNDFARYHTPMMATNGLMAGLGISWCVNQLLLKVKPDWAFHIKGISGE